MPNAEIVEQMIDYIINHKDNLNGNILMEMLEQINLSVEEQSPGSVFA